MQFCFVNRMAIIRCSTNCLFSSSPSIALFFYFPICSETSFLQWEPCLKHKKYRRALFTVQLRDTREGWPLLAVETQASGDSRNTYERGPFLGWFVRLIVPIQDFCPPCLGCSNWLSTEYFFPHCTLFHCICPHRPASWAVSRAASPVS